MKMENNAHIREVRIRCINGSECLETRPLWEEVFSEDTRLFTEYYFRVKMPCNEGVVLEGAEGLRAMLFLTPEKLRVYETTVDSAYIVGVATKQQFRHRGYMVALLKESMRLMYDRQMPFFFLMPASAAIYEPFDFRFIYDRPLWDVNSLRMEQFRELNAADVGKIADFSQRYLEKYASVHIQRDAAYDNVLLKEMDAQEGRVLGLFAKQADNPELAGICLYTCEEGEADIQEVLMPPALEAAVGLKRSGARPGIMARIVHLPALLGLLRTREWDEAFSFLLQVTDSLIAENNGVFLCHASGQECDCIRMHESSPVSDIPVWRGSVAELVQIIFGYNNGEQIISHEIWNRLRLLAPVWINEIV